jgi:hypothetical protein
MATERHAFPTARRSSDGLVVERVRSVVEIATAQSAHNLPTRKHEDAPAYCEHHKIGFIPEPWRTRRP